MFLITTPWRLLSFEEKMPRKWHSLPLGVRERGAVGWAPAWWPAIVLAPSLAGPDTPGRPLPDWGQGREAVWAGAGGQGQTPLLIDVPAALSQSHLALDSQMELLLPPVFVLKHHSELSL